MGQYNPHAPYILGQEWVPIRNAHYQSDGIIERGYAFTLNATTTPVSGAFYVNEYPPNVLAQACDFISVYPAGRETLTGPIKKVRIRASAVVVTNPGSIDITAGVAALYTPEDGDVIVFDADSVTNSQLQVSFDTESVAALLLGKRIVDVRLLYSMRSANTANSDNMTFRIHNQSAFKGVIFPEATEVTYPLNKISVLSLTELNATWDANVGFRNQRTVLPWRFQELNRFRATAPAAEALTIFMQNGSDGAEIFPVLLDYLEMEVVYCEETRVLYGGFRTYDSNFNSIGLSAASLNFYGLGAIAVQLYNPVTFTPGATLPAGDYVVTIYHRDMASRSIFQGTPKIHAVREYYQLPNQRTRWVKQTTVENEEFTAVEPDQVLTQITLHTASQIVTGVHSYGTSVGAPIYGVRTATQTLEDTPADGGTYSQVRYYARRYGNTMVPLQLATTSGTNAVTISVEDFDALPEIVDGWREVTLRFTTGVVISPTAGTSDWRWSASSEVAGNQWQIMVASGPTGAWPPNPTAAATGPATYWTPTSGNVAALTWQSPSVSGVALDTTSDAVLILSQDPPTVTGFALTNASQPLDVALRCSSPPGCIPTGISYVQTDWEMNVVCDTYSTPVTGGWNGTDTDQTWTVFAGAANHFGKVNGVGQITHVAVNTSNGALINGVTLVDVEVTATFISPVIVTGDDFRAEVVARRVDVSNYYAARVRFETVNVLGFDIFRVVGGSFTTLASVTVPNFGYAVGTPIRLSIRVIGPALHARIWNASDPSFSYELNVVDGFITAAGQVAVQTFVTGSLTNPMPLTIGVDDFTVVPTALVDASYEIQRMDEVDTEWQTVLNTTNLCVNSFADYEARVGVISWYRMRVLNALDFAGPWVTGSATIPSPGVAVARGASSVLIFTSNAQPDSNLAYVMQWEGQPAELFSFPEADTVTLQRLFGRDFFLAMRPLERGGERFTRTLLVNNAAIALPSLADFRELRDLAWADLDYVCVRDELGNRWFATIIVPEGAVRGDRTIYLAQIEVIETTNVPSPVDPA